MAEIREKLEKDGTVLTDEVKNLLEEDIAAELKEEPKKEQEKEEDSDQELLDSCISLSEDQMKATLNFTPVMGLGLAEKMDVGDVLRIMKHHDIKQGIKNDVIIETLNKKE